jgi:hypothetical protein
MFFIASALNQLFRREQKIRFWVAGLRHAALWYASSAVCMSYGVCLRDRPFTISLPSYVTSVRKYRHCRERGHANWRSDNQDLLRDVAFKPLKFVLCVRQTFGCGVIGMPGESASLQGHRLSGWCGKPVHNKVPRRQRAVSASRIVRSPHGVPLSGDSRLKLRQVIDIFRALSDNEGIFRSCFSRLGA